MRTTLVVCVALAAISALSAATAGCSMGASTTALPPASAGGAEAPSIAPMTIASETAPRDPLAVLSGRWVGLDSRHSIVITRDGDGAAIRYCSDPAEHEDCYLSTTAALGLTFRAAFIVEVFRGVDEFDLEIALASSGETMHVRPVGSVAGTEIVEEDFEQSDMLAWARDIDEGDAAHQDFYSNVVSRDESGEEDAADDEEGGDETAPSDLQAVVGADRELFLELERGALARIGRDPRALDREAALAIELRMFDVLETLGCGDRDRGYADCEQLSDPAISLLAAFLRDGMEPRRLIGSVPATVTVSSMLEGFPAEMMFDGGDETAWISTQDDLVGASIAIELPADARILEVLITPGYLGAGRFVGNQRIAGVRVTHAGDAPRDIDVPVEREGLFPLGVAGGGGLWTIEVLATQTGTRTDWTEICVSELRVIGTSPAPSPRDGIAPTYQLAPPR